MARRARVVRDIVIVGFDTPWGGGSGLEFSVSADDVPVVGISEGRLSEFGDAQ